MWSKELRDRRVREVDFLVAEQRRLERGRLVVLASRRLRIQQIQTAFLARGGNQLTAFVFEDRRRVVRIEVVLVGASVDINGNYRRREEVVEITEGDSECKTIP